jgi:hypothetical protein
MSDQGPSMIAKTIEQSEVSLGQTNIIMVQEILLPVFQTYASKIVRI